MNCSDATPYANSLNFTLNLLYNSALDSISYSAAFMVAAIAANFFLPILSAPLAITGVSIYFANITVNLFQEIHNQIVNSFKEKLFKVIDSLEKNWPYAPHFILISGLALSIFSLLASVPIILSYALLTAIIITIKKNKDNNNVVPTLSSSLSSYSFMY